MACWLSSRVVAEAWHLALAWSKSGTMLFLFAPFLPLFGVCMAVAIGRLAHWWPKGLEGLSRNGYSATESNQ